MRRAAVLGFGVLAIALVVVAVMLTARDTMSPKATLETMPNNMNAVSGWNLHQLFEYERLKPVWNTPVVQMYLTQANTRSGVDITALSSLTAGSRFLNGRPEVMYIVKGKFDKEVLSSLIRIVCTTEVVVGGHTLQSCDFGGILPTPERNVAELTDDDAFKPTVREHNREQDAPARNEDTAPVATISTESPREPQKTLGAITTLGPIAVGVLDSETFVAGTIDLLEAYLGEGAAVGQNSSLTPLVTALDQDAFGWGALTVGGIFDALKELVPAITGFPQLATSTLTFTVHLREQIGLNVVLDVGDEGTATLLEPLLSMALETGIHRANESLAALRESTPLAHTLTRTGSKLTLLMTINVPSVPAL